MNTLNAVDSETAAINLHRELRALLEAYIEMRKDTNSEPTFESEHDPDKRAERALYNHRPLADWETSVMHGVAQQAGVLGRENDAFHRALRKYPDAFEALHSFWNDAFASQPSPAAMVTQIELLNGALGYLTDLGERAMLYANSTPAATVDLSARRYPKPNGCDPCNYPECKCWESPSRPGSSAGNAEEFLPRDAWNELVHKDDRTSPEDYPDMCLISFDELKDYMARHTAAQPQPSAVAADLITALDLVIGHNPKGLTYDTLEQLLSSAAHAARGLRAALTETEPQPTPTREALQETIWGTIAAVYGELDAEDCAWIDKVWANQRGYILPTNGTSTLSRPHHSGEHQS